jgi:ATP-binding cassette subfamily F protein 3
VVSSVFIPAASAEPIAYTITTPNLIDSTFKPSGNLDSKNAKFIHELFFKMRDEIESINEQLTIRTDYEIDYYMKLI